MQSPILVTGAAGQVGSVGRNIVEQLISRKLPVRAHVRREDERSEYLRSLGAEIVVGDLTDPNDVVRILQGCRRAYFGMSVAPNYLEATTVMTAAALQQNDLEVLVNISQMTVSQMTLTSMTNSPQQKLHWLAEQVLNWSKLPVVHVRPTAFLEHFFFSSWAAQSIAETGTIRLPFKRAKTSPIAVADIARTVCTILENPTPHIGKIYDLTGPRSQTIYDMALEYEAALGRAVKYIDVDFKEWEDTDFRPKNLPEHVSHHILEMARLHSEDRYDRETDNVEKITGRKATSVKEYVLSKPEIFGIASAQARVSQPG